MTFSLAWATIARRVRRPARISRLSDRVVLSPRCRRYSAVKSSGFCACNFVRASRNLKSSIPLSTRATLRVVKRLCTEQKTSAVVQTTRDYTTHTHTHKKRDRSSVDRMQIRERRLPPNFVPLHRTVFHLITPENRGADAVNRTRDMRAYCLAAAAATAAALPK